MGELGEVTVVGVFAHTIKQFDRVCSKYTHTFPNIFVRVQSLNDVKKNNIQAFATAFTKSGGGYSLFPHFYKCVKYKAEKDNITIRSEKRKVIKILDHIDYQELKQEKLREENLSTFMEIGS